MPMDVKWDDPEQTIIMVTISAPITWEMFDAGVDEAIALAKTVSHRVDIISNPGDTQMPPGPPMPHLRRAFERFPKNLVMDVGIITNLFARIMSSVAGQVYLGPRFKAVDSLEAARAAIHKARAEAAQKEP